MQSQGYDKVSKANAAAAHARQAAKKNLDDLFAPRVFDQYDLTEDGFALERGARR